MNSVHHLLIDRVRVKAALRRFERYACWNPVSPTVDCFDSIRQTGEEPLHFSAIYTQSVRVIPRLATHVETVLHVRVNSAGIVEPIPILLLATPHQPTCPLQHCVRPVRASPRFARQGN